jgi:hypothetical protein
MANYFYVTLDVTGPGNPSLSIAGGATYATQQLVDLSIGTTDVDTLGYEMKIWGSVDPAYDSNIAATEGGSLWFAYNNSKQIRLSSGDGAKTINLKLRDSVHNESSSINETISLDMSLPEANVGSPDVNVISLKPNKDIFNFSFSSVELFEEYKVKVVSSENATHDTGTLIGSVNGSLKTVGNAGNYSAPINVTIKGADLQAASSGGGQKIIKVFIRDIAGQWSV